MRMIKMFALVLVGVFSLTLTTACASSSHKTTQIRTYDDEPEQKRSEDDTLDSDYKMQSEGEMKGR